MTPEEIRRLPFASLIDMGEFDCCCGKRHGSGIRHVVIQSGAVQRLPELLAELRYLGVGQGELLSLLEEATAGGPARLRKEDAE